MIEVNIRAAWLTLPSVQCALEPVQSGVLARLCIAEVAWYGHAIWNQCWKTNKQTKKKRERTAVQPCCLFTSFLLFFSFFHSQLPLFVWTLDYTYEGAHFIWYTGNIESSHQNRSYRSTAWRFAYYVTFAFRLYNVLGSHLCDTAYIPESDARQEKKKKKKERLSGRRGHTVTSWFKFAAFRP